VSAPGESERLLRDLHCLQANGDDVSKEFQGILGSGRLSVGRRLDSFLILARFILVSEFPWQASAVHGDPASRRDGIALNG